MVLIAKEEFGGCGSAIVKGNVLKNILAKKWALEKGIVFVSCESPEGTGTGQCL